jgi:crotonobetainyl-CoA:carnitine CoA-transferase CaiB-like acyl-CoA transferase
MPNTFEGIVVVDLTQNIAGPYCAQLLGDFGADVIKIEKPGHGDDVRRYAPAWHGEAAAFLTFNRNKRSVLIDLKNAAGRDVLSRLIGRADVFIHSLRPGDDLTFGLDYERLAQLNPRLIYCAVSGFGEKGPRKDFPGYDPVAQAYTGMMTSTGHPDSGPERIAIPLIDMGAGMWSFIGVMAALHDRIKSGRGARVSTSLLEVGVQWMALLVSNFLATGRLPERCGSASPILAPYQAFKTVDGLVFIAGGNDRLYVKLCGVLGLDGLVDDPRFVTNAARCARREELAAIIEGATSAWRSAELMTSLREAGVPCGPINTLKEVVEDPQVAALGMLRGIDGFRVPDFKMVDLPVSIDGRKADVRMGPPRLGEHTDDVLRWAGYSNREISGLKKNSVVG